MRRTLAATLIAWSLLALAGCASTDHVLFVTKTSIGIDFDMKPATASIAYDRIEGYVAPRYPNGEIPPVVASVKSDGAIFNPTIRQVYATGDAAVIAAGGKLPGRNRTMKGTQREMMFFGTTTTTGIKVGFTTALPDSFIFGFKRKEYSYIPLGTIGTGDNARDVYPSVLASIDTAANVAADGTKENTSLTNSQFFATGQAARLLAASPAISGAFQTIAREEILRKQKQNVQGAQAQANSINELLGSILAGYSDDETSVPQKRSIVAMAKGAGMDLDNNMTIENFEQKLTAYSSSGSDQQARALVQAKLQALKGQVTALLVN